MRRQLLLLVIAISLAFSSSGAVFAEYPDGPNDLQVLKEKLTKSLVVVKWSGNKKGIAFAGDYSLTQDQKNFGINSLLVTNFSNISDELNTVRSCFGATRSKDVALEYLGKSYTGTCQTYNSDQVDFATINSSLNLAPLRLYDSYIPSPGQWVIVVHYAEGFGINFATSRVRLVNSTNYILGIDKLDMTLTNGGIVFNSLGNFVGVVTSFGAGSAPSNYLKVHGAPLQCQTKLKSAYTITNCPTTQDKIWVDANPGQTSQPSTTPTPIPTLNMSLEVLNAKNAATDAVNAAEEAIDAFESAKDECLSVSNSFEPTEQELYDSTDLSSYCEKLTEKASLLQQRVFAINLNLITTVSGANTITTQANLFAENADSLVAQMQDLTDVLTGTEKRFTTLSKILESLNRAEEEVLIPWSNLLERLTILPVSFQSTIKKSQNYKLSLNYVAVLQKVLNSRDAQIEVLSSIEDPAKLTSVITKLSGLSVSLSQMASFKKNVIGINKLIPLYVCQKGTLTVLASKTGKCASGFEQIPTS